MAPWKNHGDTAPHFLFRDQVYKMGFVVKHSAQNARQAMNLAHLHLYLLDLAAVEQEVLEHASIILRQESAPPWSGRTRVSP
jgi:hypothetical protein